MEFFDHPVCIVQHSSSHGDGTSRFVSFAMPGIPGRRLRTRGPKRASKEVRRQKASRRMQAFHVLTHGFGSVVWNRSECLQATGFRGRSSSVTRDSSMESRRKATCLRSFQDLFEVPFNATFRFREAFRFRSLRGAVADFWTCTCGVRSVLVAEHGSWTHGRRCGPKGRIAKATHQQGAP